MMKVFAVELNNELSVEVFDFLLGLCSKEKKAQIMRKKIKSDRDLSVAGNALAKYAIKAEFDIPVKNQIFCYNENGKPYLQGGGAFFSISHSGNLVICAVSDCEIGVDVQKIKEINPKTAEFIGADCENFFSVWTKKEAEIKRRGSGIFEGDMKELDVTNTKTFRYKEYYISVSHSTKIDGFFVHNDYDV